MDKKTVLTISGFSGAGKDYTISKLLEKNKEFSLVKSCTTRSPRKGDNNKYTYLTKEDFEKMADTGGFLEYNSYNGE